MLIRLCLADSWEGVVLVYDVLIMGVYEERDPNIVVSLSEQSADYIIICVRSCKKLPTMLSVWS